VTAALVPRALKAHIDLGMEADANAQPLHIQGNALLLREALMNVIDNAVHYAGAQAQITVRTFSHPETLGLEVEDDGPGIDTSQLDRVFERFVRATDIGSGCGLGLPIVKEIIERHGGQVHLLTVRPHGLKVRMLWPRTKLQKEPAL
jgi:two-component system sensor histidine kinase TctE